MVSDTDTILELEGINEKLSHTLNYLKKARLKLRKLRFLNIEKMQRIAELEAKLKQRDELLREACEFLDSDVFERRFQYKYRMLEEDPLVCPKEQFLNKPEIKQIMEEDNE